HLTQIPASDETFRTCGPRNPLRWSPRNPMRALHAVAASLLALTAVLAVLAAEEPPVLLAADEPLVLVQQIALPKVEGRIDHMAVDVDQHRLYVAALGNNTVEVIDLAAGRRVTSLPGMHEPQGIAVAPDLKRVVIANGEGGEVQVRDTGDGNLRVMH